MNDDQRTWAFILACWVALPLASGIGRMVFGGTGAAYAGLAVMAVILIALLVPVPRR